MKGQELLFLFYILFFIVLQLHENLKKFLVRAWLRPPQDLGLPDGEEKRMMDMEGLILKGVVLVEKCLEMNSVEKEEIIVAKA